MRRRRQAAGPRLDEGEPLTAAETPPQSPPEVDDRYRVDELIRRVPGADVWAGWDDRLQRPVRLRVLFQAGLLTNAMTVARLDHPGLLATVDIAPKPAVVVTEHVVTRPLGDRPPGSWAWTDAAAVLSRAAAAIGAAHGADLVHGALSPESIEIGPEGRVIVTDLIGLAGAPPAIDVDRLTRLLVHLVTGCPVDADPADMVEAMAATSPTPPPEIVDFVARGLDDTRPSDAERWRSRLDALPDWPTAELDELDFVRSERAWFIPAVLVIVVALITGSVGLVAGRTDLGRRLFDEARHAVGLDVRTPPTTTASAAADASGGGGPSAVIEPVRPFEGGLAATAPIAALLDFDPGGDGSEHPELLRLVNDAEPSDGWHTERYNSGEFGSLKDGVGLVVRLERSTPIDQLVVSSPDTGWDVAVYGSPGSVPSDLDAWGPPLGVATGVQGDALVTVDGAEVSALLVWITDLGSAGDDGHRVTITRIDPLVADG